MASLPDRFSAYQMRCILVLASILSDERRLLMGSCKGMFLCLVFILSVCLSGCALGPASQIPQRPPQAYEPVMTDYFLQPGDNLDIKFFYNPELNENVTIRPDGRISLQLIDEVKAAGLTPMQLDNVLTERYGGQLKSPILAVIVKSFEGQKIYVGGEVNEPQVLNIVGRVNALQAIFDAGGLTPDAKLSNTVIIRRGPNNAPIARIVNLERALRGELPEKEYLLVPYDMIYIPKTAVAQVDQFLSHLYSFIPRNIGLGFTYELHAVDDD